MSDAKVTFLGPDFAPTSDPARRFYFGFACPKHKGRRCEGLLIANAGHGIKRDKQNQNGGKAQWDWNGDLAAPTFGPSINCGGCWHGYIRKGRCETPPGVDEPEPK